MLSVMMIAAALGAHVAEKGGAEEMIAPRLEIRNPDGEFQVIGSPWHTGWLVVPMTSHSALVPRAGLRNGELEIGLVPGNSNSGTNAVERIIGFSHDSNAEFWLVDGRSYIEG